MLSLCATGCASAPLHQQLHVVCRTELTRECQPLGAAKRTLATPVAH